MTTRRHLLRLIASAAVLAPSARMASAQANRVVVGGKGFTEQLLIAEITNQLLTAKGFQVDVRTGMGTTVVRAAQVNGQVDVYWEYTGTSLVTFNRVTERLTPDAALARVRELDAASGLVWLTPSRTNNTYALAVLQNAPNTAGIRTLSDMAAAYNAGRNLVMAVNAEFPGREDGLVGLQRAYGFTVSRDNQRRMETGLTYNALRDGQVDIALATGTDGRIAAFNLRTLADDKAFWPHYAMAPVVRRETLERLPALRTHLEAISARIDDDVMRRLNAQVDVERKTVAETARGFLQAQNLI